MVIDRPAATASEKFDSPSFSSIANVSMPIFLLVIECTATICLHRRNRLREKSMACSPGTPLHALARAKVCGGRINGIFSLELHFAHFGSEATELYPIEFVDACPGDVCPRVGWD